MIRAGRSERSRVPLWPLAIATFAIGSGGGVVTGLMPSMADELDASFAEIGLLVTVYSVVYAASAPLVALLGHRIPRRTLLLTSLGAFAVTSALMAFVDTVAAAALVRGVAALAAGGVTPTATVLASRSVAPERRGRAVATVFGGLTTAAVVAAPVGALLGSTVGFRAVYLGISAAALVAAAAVAVLVDTRAMVGVGSVVAVAGARPAASPRTGWVLVVLAVSMTETLAAFIVQTYAAPLLDALSGAAGSVLSGILVCYGIAGVAGNVVGGQLSDRFGAAIVLLATLVGAGLSLALLGVAGGTAFGSGAVFAVWGFCAWAANSPLQTLLLTLSGPYAQVVVASNSAAIAIGTATGSGIGGWLVDGGRVLELGSWAGVTMVVSVVLTLVVLIRCRAAGVDAGPAERRGERAVRASSASPP